MKQILPGIVSFLWFIATFLFAWFFNMDGGVGLWSLGALTVLLLIAGIIRQVVSS